MASTYKVLGQVRPSTTNATDLYTVPSGGQVVVSTLTVTNLTASTVKYDIYIGVDGAAASEANALVYQANVTPNATVTITVGLTADAGDKIIVDSSVSNALTFQAFGLEIA